jgi:hypothetical protein
MRPTLLAGLLCVTLLTACGGGGTRAPTSPVRLTVSAPADEGIVRDGAVDVRGTVRPTGATVTVRGQRAEVAGGSFHARVPLAAGVNVIDVLASDGDARPALTAVRVKRIVTVTVPDVRGLSPDDARNQLTGAGLKVDTQQTGGGLFDQLLGQSPKVCDTSPAAGDEVDAGATVTVRAGRRC